MYASTPEDINTINQETAQEEFDEVSEELSDSEVY